MLGFASIAAAPLGAVGEEGLSYDAAISDSASSVDVSSTVAAFLAGCDEYVAGQDVLVVSPSIFRVDIPEVLNADDSTSSFAVFRTAIEEVAVALDNFTGGIAVFAGVSNSCRVSDSLTTQALYQATAASTATALDRFSAFAIAYASFSDAVEASENFSAISSYSSVVQNDATAEEAVSTIVDFSANVIEVVSGSVDLPLTPSIISGVVSDVVLGIEQSSAYSIFFSSLIDSSVSLDTITARFLWAAIDDSQNADWGAIASSSSTTWGASTTEQTANWSAINHTSTTWEAEATEQSPSWTPIQTQT